MTSLLTEAAYVRTPIQTPLLSLTASVTLRDQPIHRHRKNMTDTASIRSTNTIRSNHTARTDETYMDAQDSDEEDEAKMTEIDLLGGLAGGESLVVLADIRSRSNASYTLGAFYTEQSLLAQRDAHTSVPAKRHRHLLYHR
jgi:hypothetical protein